MFPFSCLSFFFRDRDRALAQAGAPPIQPQRTDGPRFTGGGFNLKQPGQGLCLDQCHQVSDDMQNLLDPVVLGTIVCKITFVWIVFV